MGETLSPVHPPDVERRATPFFPHHLIGWIAVMWLLTIAFFPAYWGKLNDVLANNASQLGAGGGALGVAALPLWQAHFRKKDRSVLLGVVTALTGVVALFGVLFLLAMLGQALR